jgi:DoxX-like family
MGATSQDMMRNCEMTKGKIIYWLSTGLICLLYVAGAIIYLTQRPMVEEGFAFLGYPAYLITVLIVGKIAAPLVILTRVSVRLSDLAYAGIFYHLSLALSAHLNAGDGGFVPAIIGLVLVTVSFLSQNAGRKVASPNVPSLPGLTA